MRSPTGVIWRKELRKALRTPSAWFVFAVSAALSGLGFCMILRFGHLSVGDLIPSFLDSLLFAMPIPIAFFTMPLFARDRANRTLETLLTAPVTDAEVVVGKFIAALVLSWVALACSTAGFALCLHLSEPAPPYAPEAFAGAVFAAALAAAAITAFGTLVSLLARREAAAAATTLIIGLVTAALFSDFLGLTLPEKINPIFSLDCFARGVADSRPIFFLLSLTALLLFCAVRLLEGRRWLSSTED